jgi:hypothetical protein
MLLAQNKGPAKIGCSLLHRVSMTNDDPDPKIKQRLYV